MTSASFPDSVPSYLQQRLFELSITPELNKFVVKRESRPGQWTEEPVPFFESDEHGNIVINYFNLNGLRYSWKKEGTKTPRYFQRKRLVKPEGDRKYSQERGSGQFPFFTPGVLKKFKACKEAINVDGTAVAPIPVLYVVEGEFKAFKGNICGLDIIGIPSIHGFYNGDVHGKLHEDIQELIVMCQVEKIVFLVDADLLSIRWEEKKDLAKRPESFFAAVKSFRESLQLLLDDDKVALAFIYVMHLQTRLMNEAKGLDDLLVKYSSVHDEIRKDLGEFQFAKKYFTGRLINDTNKDLGNLKKYLGLADENDFYKTYGEFIGDKEFLFRGKRFEYNRDKKEVCFVRHEDADKFVRIGSNWVKIIKKVNPYGQIEDQIIPWKITEIERDYKHGRNADVFISQLQRYDDFCNEPAWVHGYKRVHNGCFNLCEPLKWDFVKGPFPNTYKFLKHIFQGAGSISFDQDGTPVESSVLGDQFTVILDWLSIILRHPKQMVPVPILVSKENGTGKSTFLKWLNMIFGTNMCILGNEQFKMKFNGHYISKFIIAIDEGFLDVDKKSEKERLKQLVTANVAYLENKGMNVTQIQFFGKLIICSNDADRVMKIDDGESRWFVVKVPVIPKKRVIGKELVANGETRIQGQPIDVDAVYELPDLDPDIEKKVFEEIPAILYFLRERQIFHPRTDRLWFKPEWFITDQMKVIVNQTKNRTDRVVEDYIADQFLTYRLSVLRYPRKHLIDELSKVSKYKIDSEDLNSYLTDRRGLRLGDPIRVKIPNGITESGAIDFISPASSARCFEFRVEDWLTADQLVQWRSSNPASSPNEDKPPF